MPKRQVIIPIGPSIAYVPLTQGQFALIDREDADLFLESSWFAWWNPCTQSFYACRHDPNDDGRPQLMHRFLLGLKRGDKTEGDHANMITLDYRRHNLRLATRSQNSCNQSVKSSNTSGFKGVTQTRNGRWRVRIRFEGKRKHIGIRDTKEEAAQLYASTALILHGEFARVD